MVEPVKRRTYDAVGRQAASAATRQRIVDAGRELVLARGYRATTVAAIAEKAEVNVDTVYRLVGRKPVLMRDLVEQAISGTDHAVAAEQRAHVLAIQAEPDPRVRFAIYARAIRETHARLAPLFLALRDASSTEPEAKEIWQQVSDRRAANLRRFVSGIAELGALRDGLSIDDAADTVWATNSPELFLMLTEERGWSPDRYEAWLADSWCRLLLSPAWSLR
jgi:AcrR family transcriptional regulator